MIKMGGLIFFAILAFIVFIAIIKTAVIVPQKTAYIVERLGKYRCTLDAGFHILVPFFDRVAYRHTLKEQAIDVPPQECITKDNIAVSVDGILYMQVMDPAKASYGIGNYLFATTQLAQTTMRSEMGKLDLDRSFEERTSINAAIVAAVDKASDPWGIKVTRYEIKNITPPRTIRDAMEKQMRAEREKRAMIAESEGERQAKINRAEGEKQEAINLSDRVGEHAARPAVPRAVRQPREDEQHDDHPVRPRECRRRHQGLHDDSEEGRWLTAKASMPVPGDCEASWNQGRQK